MTRILVTSMLTGVALATFAAVPARSVDAVNGVNPNGVNPNGVNPNGTTLQGTSPDRISPNRINPNSPASTVANSAGELGRVVAVELTRR